MFKFIKKIREYDNVVEQLNQKDQIISLLKKDFNALRNARDTAEKKIGDMTRGALSPQDIKDFVRLETRRAASAGDTIIFSLAERLRFDYRSIDLPPQRTVKCTLNSGSVVSTLPKELSLETSIEIANNIADEMRKYVYSQVIESLGWR